MPASTIPSTPFQLSRIYGMGWSAARGKLAAGDTHLGDRHAFEFNPYPAEPEHGRWAEGFKAGLRGWRGRSPSAARFGRS